jgi:TRAP transporter TAXI family solute receptor
MTVASATPGGAWYPINVAHNSFVEKATGVGTRITPGGSRDNVTFVSKGDADLGITHLIMAYNGYNGLSPFDAPMKNIRHIATLTPAAYFVGMRKDNTTINKIEDIVGKRLGLFPQGNLVNTMTFQLFEALGYSEEDLVKAGTTISYLSYSDGIAQLIDGQIDCYVNNSVWPSPMFAEIDNNPGMRIIGVDDELFQKLNAIHPGYTQITIPANVYKSFSNEVLSFGSYTSLIVRDDMSDDFAYAVTKEFWENFDEIKEMAPDVKLCKPEDALNGNQIPVHPGAQKYYDEVGTKAK